MSFRARSTSFFQGHADDVLSPFVFLSAAAALLALSGAGCSASVGTGAGAAGGTVSGHVTEAPTCPVERLPPDPRCAPRPYAAALEIDTASGARVAEVHADAAGFYSVALSPGSYVIGPAPGAPAFPRGMRKPFAVSPNMRTSVDLVFDTGIR